MLDVAIHRSIGSAMADGATVCQLRGELVSREASVVRALRGRLAHARTLLVDLRGVGAFDRPGLGALVGVLRSAHPGTGRVRVCADQPALVKLLRAEGLDRLYPLVAEPSSLQPATGPK
ncbi:MAG TPA: STAS domain-containing protein [Acidimicrobiales bacterium]|jgi:anti-anti-sigma factor